MKLRTIYNIFSCNFQITDFHHLLCSIRHAKSCNKQVQINPGFEEYATGIIRPKVLKPRKRVLSILKYLLICVDEIYFECVCLNIYSWFSLSHFDSIVTIVTEGVSFIERKLDCLDHVLFVA